MDPNVDVKVRINVGACSSAKTSPPVPLNLRTAPKVHVICPYTITKHGKKIALKIECSSFIHGFVHACVVDLQFLLQIASAIFGIFRRVIYRWKGLENTFPMVYHTPENSKNSSRKLQKKLTARVVGLHKTVDKRTALDFECGFS